MRRILPTRIIRNLVVAGLISAATTPALAADSKPGGPPGLLDRIVAYFATDDAGWLECAIGVPIAWFDYEPGDDLLMSRLGWFYEAGACFFRDPERAAALYRPRAEAGNDTAAFLLGRLYLRGHGVEKDAEKARKLFDLGALRWTFVNEHRLSYLRDFMLWRREVPPELTAAIGRVQRLDPSEYFRLAEALFNGADGLPRDPALARNLYEKAGIGVGAPTDIGYAVAHKLIDGSLPLRAGETRRQQMMRGLNRLFYVAIVARGYPKVAEAQRDIARFVEEGKGVDPDPFFAFEFYTLAQKNGLDTAADIERVRARLIPERIAEAEDDVASGMYGVKLEFHRKFIYRKK